MKRIGLLGCGKIGQNILENLSSTENVEITFIQDPFYKMQSEYPVLAKPDKSILEQTDLVIESAMSDVLKENADMILQYCDMMVFSVTAFADAQFYYHVQSLLEQYYHRIYLPHGAILGIDGIADGKEVIEEVCIETVKNPKSLGRKDTERTILYEGSCREACKLYPRNVNVHATIALAGIGFDKTHSVIVSDPAVDTNTHIIHVKGQGISFTLNISSFANGGITGKYTPYSAIGSVHRVLGDRDGFLFV
ncbi:MAG: DUF108 domain-containing protein [Clostridiales bacterium]|nr:DUF108 domain-containing protein [Clostridiales bacterium]